MGSIQSLKWLCWCIMIAILVPIYLAGCSPSLPRATPLLTIVPPSNVTSLPTIYTSTPSLAPPIATPSPTPTLVSSISAPCPKFTIDERRALTREMLETNGGCELPCWWGIVPGKTRWQEVRCFLGLCGAGDHGPDGSVLHDVMYVPLDPYKHSDYGIRLIFTECEGVVQSIGIHSEAFVGEVPERLHQDWRRYSLDQVLSRYGEPSQVMLELWPNPPEPYYPYRLFVFYEELGILIAYEGPAIPGETFQVCPEFERVTYLRLWLQSSEQGPSLLQLADLDLLEQAQMLPLEEATGMDVETFYEAFREAEAEICLESPAEIWP